MQIKDTSIPNAIITCHILFRTPSPHLWTRNSGHAPALHQPSPLEKADMRDKTTLDMI